jgi:hypothetical protein
MFHELNTHEGHKDGVSNMPNVTHVLKDLPPKLLTLIRKLDAIEGKYLLRYAPPLEPVGESDWLPPRFVWQNDADLFAG